MKGVNDDAGVLATLFKQLLRIRVKPYYLYQADLTRGANHFRTPLSTGLSIMRELQGHISGMAIPHFVIDAPGGGGKIPVLPDDYLVGREGGNIILKNYENQLFSYPDVEPTPFPDVERGLREADSIEKKESGSDERPLEKNSGPSLLPNGHPAKNDRNGRVPGIASPSFTKPADRSPL
jgi:hypothetical protein